jgi:hypothetical protein
MRDGVYCGLLYRVTQDKSHYTSAHIIYHNFYSEIRSLQETATQGYLFHSLRFCSFRVNIRLYGPPP